MEYRVRFEPSGTEIRVTSGTTLIEATRRAGLPIASACGAGGLCGRCGLRILAGAGALPPEPEAEREAKQRNRVESELRLACCTPIEGDLVVTAAYW